MSNFVKTGGLWLGLVLDMVLLLLMCGIVSAVLFVHMRRVVTAVRQIVDMVDKLSTQMYKQKIPDSLVAVVLAKHILRTRDVGAPGSLSQDQTSANWQRLLDEEPALTDQLPSELKEMIKDGKDLPDLAALSPAIDMRPPEKHQTEPDEIHSESEKELLAVKKENYKQKGDPAYKTMADIDSQVFDEPINKEKQTAEPYDMAGDTHEPTAPKKG